MKDNVTTLIKYFTPSSLQVLYSFVLAIFITLYWCRDQLNHALTPPGSKESIDTFHEILKQAVDRFTNNEIVAFLSLALIWALVGIFILAVVYETVNIFITLRNNKLMTTQFTHAEENKKTLLQTTVTKLAIVAGFIVFLGLAIGVLFPFWHNLIDQPAGQFFEAKNVFKEIMGTIGLGATVCLLWRWILISLPKFS